MKDYSIDCLTERHFLLFGTITHWFAKYEMLMQQIMATVAGSDYISVKLLTLSLNFGQKHATLFNLLRHGRLPFDQYDRISAFLQVPYALLPLRNDIAHSIWVARPPSNSIQPDWIFNYPPSILPVYEGLGEPNRHFMEHIQEEACYTVADLDTVAVNLATNYSEFREYLRKVGLITP
ncbi:hypothetical protein QU481_01955 [Crenobacter sp. SG2303]|uniref:Uncharacterized protein n=1 Tax=Crenobacter oryzisoli TaxID=3056844 RepID=A0ABT7XIV6_9NEIS|nr:hypothetical protein [Crenobacter sp. SG2303]MDN0073658.1 hypothetical protein [Crenobacter sp. SG2303]